MSQPLPPVTNVLKFDTQWSYGSDNNVHTHLFCHFTGTSPAAADLVNLASAWNTGLDLGFRTLRVPTTTLVATTVTDLTTRSSNVGSSSAGTAGTGTGTPLPAETCVLINLHVARRYKGGHPRIYLPLGDNTDMLDPQHWKPSFITQVANGWQTALNKILSVSGLPPTLDNVVSVSYYAGKDPVTGKPLLRPTPVVDIVPSQTVNAVPASQRRRMNR